VGIGNYSLEKLYNFIKVKSAQVVLNFTHPPDKNANSVIMKAGTVAAGYGPAGNINANLVKAGYLYYYNNGEWTQPVWDSAANAGSNYLLGIALWGNRKGGGRATFGDAVGSPSEVGMLLRGVTYSSVLGGSTSGAPVYGDKTKNGRFANAPPGSGNWSQILGWALENDPASADSLIFFDPQYPGAATVP
jgi:hypothetical protein